MKEAKRRLEEELDVECRANAAYEAYRARGRRKDGRRFGRPPDRYRPPATPAGKINVTDPDSPDFGHLEPMVDAAERELTAIGIDLLPEVVLADAGYWHHVQIDAIVSRGMQVLIPPDAGKRKGERPGWNGGLYAFMRRVLETETAEVFTPSAKA